ncbi:protein PSK SIMULATOR 1-like [Juglans microcarpa x Juglans regia]|uniref:protein PSK SIMULATOR 1-like n=1 Tax=Juglans microcarpa x Juglans regia TaxID=2249226 RepID=UPI001B7F51F7|nr:protein PSK SIMULATOR 1-like [Juglans microcarpa x Juglans regia]XP_041004872.1 protein PSK SIMULATOR 1-like [Juglans microcarpa x Juglans regia]XP_041004873.1 protein PSK SIMULATOR 1-like [Juglans microcarpa x Juglans regia]
MGGLCSRSSNEKYAVSKANGYTGDRFQSNVHESSNLTAPPPQTYEVREPKKETQEPVADRETGASAAGLYGATGPDDFYDGIPRYNPGGPLSQKSRSVRSRQAAVAKVSEVSSRLGKAGSLGLGKAVEVLDTLGSSMTNLNSGSGFVSGAATKGNEITILAFEVANTIMKGSNLMQSLSKRSIRHLKEVVLPSDGVQHLVSTEMDELLRIVAADKREELKIFSGEVVRFGNRCKDAQWHNLDRYFEKISRDFTPQKQLKDEADLVMQQLMTSVQFTAELYHELNALDRFQQEYQRRCQEDSSFASQKGDNLGIMKAELKSQKKQVKNLKKKSLWSRSMEEVMEKLVDIVRFLHLEIHNTFSSTDARKPVDESLSSRQRLGPAGLSLHYANIVIQIDNLVLRSSSAAPNTRDALYESLPPSIKSALRSKLQPFNAKVELTITDIKAEMEKTLQWLVPIATNTAKAHHGFGWVGEWASTGSELNRKATVQTDVIRIETLHHADKEKTEAYIIELVLWLHQLINQSKSNTNGGGKRSTTTQQPKQEPSTNAKPPMLTSEEQEMLQRVSKKRWSAGGSKSQKFNSSGKAILEKQSRLSKSYNHSSRRRSKQLLSSNEPSSGLPVIELGIEKGHA